MEKYTRTIVYEPTDHRYASDAQEAALKEAQALQSAGDPTPVAYAYGNVQVPVDSNRSAGEIGDDWQMRVLSRKVTEIQQDSARKSNIHIVR